MDELPAINARERDPSWIAEEIDRLIRDADVGSYDVFLSYASDDSHIADKLKQKIEHSGLSCFMASKDIKSSQLWQEEIRSALLRSQSVLVLLTPNSKDRRWVLLEVGAAWAIGKKLIPALMFVKPKELPEALIQYQSMKIETQRQREELIQELTIGSHKIDKADVAKENVKDFG